MNHHDLNRDELQKMLALKRHESPPPRFFKGFSDQVIGRLHAPEPLGKLTWGQRLGLDLESKPILVCVSGVVVCGLLLVGLIASLRVEPPKPAPPSPDDKTHLVVTPSLNAAAGADSPLAPAVGGAPLPRLGEPVMVSAPLPFRPVKPQPASQPAANGTGGK